MQTQTPIFDALEAEFKENGYPPLPLDSGIDVPELRSKVPPLFRECPKCKSLFGQMCRSVRTGLPTLKFHNERYMVARGD